VMLISASTPIRQQDGALTEDKHTQWQPAIDR
jgi:hypothetical protein